MKAYNFILLLGLWTHLSGQIPQHDLLFSHEVEQKLASGELGNPTASYYYSYTGNYQKAISTYDIPVSWGVDTIDLSDFKLVDALDRIVEEAKRHRIVIISESHLKPQHRTFAKVLIDSLFDDGFRHVGLETLSTRIENPGQLLDSSLHERGFALNSPVTGFYTREPQMADIVRASLRKGIQLFAYEMENRISGKDRDEIHADNIIRYMETHEAEKIIILCGWHHAIESNLIKRGNSYWMAKYLKDKSGIDPLTIYQDNFTEKEYEKEHPLLSVASIQKPVVFTDTRGEIVRLTPHVDIEVIHPKTKFISGRPSWVYNGSRKNAYFVEIDSDKVGYPVFVKAYISDEYDLGVPFDIVEVRTGDQPIPVVLEPGEYVIVVEGKHKIDVNHVTIE